MSRSHRRTTRRLLAGLAVAAACVPVVGLDSPSQAAPEPPPIDAPEFREIGRVPVPEDVELGTYHTQSGWMVLNPASRRGYTLVEIGNTRTIIESFDLDTLQLRQRAIVNGFPIPGGAFVNSAGSEIDQGDVIHVVDPVTKRIYLPMSGFHPYGAGDNRGQDDKRHVSYFLVIDEEAFDHDPTRAYGAFSFPAGEQATLAAYPLLGMALSREGVAPGRPGKLLSLFSAVTSHAPFGAPGLYDHRLALWDPSGVRLGQAAPVSVKTPFGDTNQFVTDPIVGEWSAILRGCSTATITLPKSNASIFGAKNYQWGILPMPGAVFTVCQSAPGAAIVIRVGIDPRTGSPLGDEQVFPLGKAVGDVLVDQSGGRLLLESHGDGSTWWVFDAQEMRFTGSMAGNLINSTPLGAGLDPATGRFYTLAKDTCVVRAGKAAVGALDLLPVQGGLRVAESRLDPVPAARNVLPKLAFPSPFAIRVDPVTRRVFIRRGTHLAQTATYPSCNEVAGVGAIEPFYRVYEDRIPIVERPAAFDDTGLTTNTPEAAGRTEASFLGTGSGYGARSLLIGGIDKPTSGLATAFRSLCGKEDREVLFGSVGKVEVSEQGPAAEAAALDADASTREKLGDPVSRCRPQSGTAAVDACQKLEVGSHRVDGDAREFGFDQAEKGVDENKDGCDDRDGRNRYAAKCLGTLNSSSPGFDDDEHKVPRDGFEAKARCDDKKEAAVGSATSSLRKADLDKAGLAVTVGRSSSEVTTERGLGKGVTVKVDSIARGVEIAGVGTIGVVRAEATSTATGRDGGAFGSFKRTICDIDIAGVVVSGCLMDERSQRSTIDLINKALGSRGTLRLRTPDGALAQGSPHGYLAGVQRDRKEQFGDQAITKDFSLAVPALEVITYQGEGDGGAGRQVTQLAGAQATTSYGIVCTYGKRVDGSCAASGEEGASSLDMGGLAGVNGGGESVIERIVEYAGGPAAPGESIVTRLLRGLPRAVAEALRLLFNNPRELGLLAALWALLYAPCYLGDRRRAVRAIAALRL